MTHELKAGIRPSRVESVNPLEPADEPLCTMNLIGLKHQAYVRGTFAEVVGALNAQAVGAEQWTLVPR